MGIERGVRVIFSQGILARVKSQTRAQKDLELSLTDQSSWTKVAGFIHSFEPTVSKKQKHIASEVKNRKQEADVDPELAAEGDAAHGHIDLQNMIKAEAATCRKRLLEMAIPARRKTPVYRRHKL